MSTAVANGITLKEFLALPDDGVYREVRRGVLREYRGEDATRRTVDVHRPDADPQLFNVQQTLTADRALPGFSTPVRTIFE